MHLFAPVRIWLSILAADYASITYQFREDWTVHPAHSCSQRLQMLRLCGDAWARAKFPWALAPSWFL